jgi:hypothetical protein
MFWKGLWKRITKTFSRSLTVNMPELVLDADDLLRRIIFTDPTYIRPDFTVTPMAFRPRRINGNIELGLSVDIARLTTLEKSIGDRFKYRLYSLKASYVRQIGLDCVHAPREGNEAHALIVGEIKNATAKKLSQGATRVPYPD